MPRKVATVASQKWAADPLVPVRGDRVRAGLAWRKFSNREAAERLSNYRVRLSAQALDGITTGRTKRSRKSVLRGLARVIGRPVSAGWLRGGQLVSIKSLPGLPRGALHPRTWATDNLPPMYELEAHRLAMQISRRWVTAGGSDKVLQKVLVALQYALSLGFWRQALNERRQLDYPPWVNRGMSLEEFLEFEANEFAVNMADAIRRVLRPWLEAGLDIRQEAVSAVVSWLEEVQTFAGPQSLTATLGKSGVRLNLCPRVWTSGTVGASGARLKPGTQLAAESVAKSRVRLNVSQSEDTSDGALSERHGKTRQRGAGAVQVGTERLLRRMPLGTVPVTSVSTKKHK